jgi:hypothetical protein
MLVIPMLQNSSIMATFVDNMVRLSSVVNAARLAVNNPAFPIPITERAGYLNVSLNHVRLIGLLPNILTAWTSDFGHSMSMLRYLCLFLNIVIFRTIPRIGKP